MKQQQQQRPIHTSSSKQMLSFAVLSRMRYLQAGSFLLCIILLVSCCTVLMPSFCSAAALSPTALDEGANLLPLTQQEISRTKSLTAAAAAGAWITKADDDLHETGGIITGLQGVVGSSYSAPKEEADEYSSGTTKSFCSRCSRLEEGAGTELQQQQEERAGETATTLQQQAGNGGLKGSPKPSSIESSDLVKTLNVPTKARSSRFRNRRMLDPNQVCTNKDISIFQGQVGFSGIPQYIVQIVNTCMSDCAPSDIHVYCGWFASAMLVNPSIFSRVAFNDCLVNGGRPLRQGDIIRFEYANSFMYPMRFKSASFC
ncbi:unnamed protein product [Sphagnum troendelagicum]|uniref:Uncharacterized protein n=1 Tax=Sphagnum troendelagicum TaxID=128251 RepID=A0ABP0U4W5_9BRYO